ncbi:MAG: thiamine pyrophosphate-binding protein [Betaproteobacteria bacterium]|nr:thiamine pyrophosphate-binding protein [Betaproteobacteria bacterium]MBI2508808.1 thiamine pyrophosphate-binding protein [Betaproteobacteria bacterium]
MNASKNLSSAIAHDAPVRSKESAEFWGSDAVAAVLRELGIRYIALNPGASYRGLHDSIVNYLGNRDPQMVLSIHDENAVAIAHGYWKASGQMMAAALHSNVGLMHATMAIFDAWCDRAAILIMGATGPWDAMKRRPWIDWIHTASDQGALIRDYTKWDNQPGSVAAALEAVLRGSQIAQTAPRGPVYVNLDIAMQEEKIGPLPVMPDIARYAAPPPVRPDPGTVAAAAQLLSGAKNPIMFAGRCTRSVEGWKARVALAEKLNLRALTNLKMAAAFPTDHRLHVGPAANRLSADLQKFIAEADVILSLDWLDLAGTLKQAYGAKPVTAKIIQVSCDAHNHRGWSMDYQAMPPVDAYLMCEPEAAVPLLLEAVKARTAAVPAAPEVRLPKAADDAVSLRGVGDALHAATRGLEVCYTHLPIGWHGGYVRFRHPLDYLGAEGGGGVGSGPGITVGAALALKGSGRLPIGVLGDGDFLMANTTIWTAVHYRIPCLMIVCNNRSFFNDELHQERVAIARGRPPENRWIGQRIGDPDIDLAAMARAQGATGIGPVTQPADVLPAIRKGIETVQAGGVCLIDARVLPGYDADG